MKYFETYIPKKIRKCGRNKFLDICDLPKLNQENRNNLARHVTINEIEELTKKSPEPEGFTAECRRVIKEPTPMFHKLP